MDEKTFTSREEILAAIKELRSRFPAHSIKPAMIAELEELEELLGNFPVAPGENQET